MTYIRGSESGKIFDEQNREVDPQLETLNLLREIRDMEETAIRRASPESLAAECKRAALLRKIAEIEVDLVGSEAASEKQSDPVALARSRQFRKETTHVLSRLREELHKLDEATQ